MADISVSTRDMVFLLKADGYAYFLTKNKTFYAPRTTNSVIQNIGGNIDIISTSEWINAVSSATEIRDALFNTITDNNAMEYTDNINKRGMSLDLKKAVVLSMLNKETWLEDGIKEYMLPEGTDVLYVKGINAPEYILRYITTGSGSSVITEYDMSSIDTHIRRILTVKLANYILGIRGVCNCADDLTKDVTYFSNTFAYNIVVVPVDSTLSPSIDTSLQEILNNNFTADQLQIIYSAVAKIDSVAMINNTGSSYSNAPYAGYVEAKYKWSVDDDPSIFMQHYRQYGPISTPLFTLSDSIYNPVTSFSIYVKVPGNSVVPSGVMTTMLPYDNADYISGPYYNQKQFYNVTADIEEIAEESTAEYSVMRITITSEYNDFIFHELLVSGNREPLDSKAIGWLYYDAGIIYLMAPLSTTDDTTVTWTYASDVTLVANTDIFGWSPVTVFTTNVGIYSSHYFPLSRGDYTFKTGNVADAYITVVYDEYNGKYTRQKVKNMIYEENDLYSIICKGNGAAIVLPDIYLLSSLADNYSKIDLLSSFGNVIINDDLTLVPAEKTELLKWSVSHKADDVYKSAITTTYNDNQYTKMIFNDMKDKVFISNMNKSSGSKVSFLFYVASVNAALLDKYSELIDATSNSVDSESNSIMKLDGSGLAKVTSANLLLNGATFMQYIDNSFFSDVQPKIANNMIATVTPIHNNYFYMFISIAGSTSIMALKFASIAQNNTYTFSICDATDLAQIFDSHSGNVWSSPKAWTGLAGATTATLTGSGYIITVDGYDVIIANTFSTGTSSIEYSTDYSDEVYLQFSVNVPYTNCKGTVPALTVNGNNTQFDCQDGIVTFTINGNSCTLNMLTGIIEYADDAFQLNTSPDSVTGIFEYMQYCTVSSIFKGVYKVTSADANEYTVSSNGVIRGDLNFTVEEIDE